MATDDREKKTSPSVGRNARNAWEAHKALLHIVDEYLLGLRIREDSYLYDLVHRLVWHDGIDPVRWIADNRKLAAKIAQIGLLDKLPDETSDELAESLRRLRHS